jgi:hypothetical protein
VLDAVIEGLDVSREEYRRLIIASTAGEIRSSSGTRLMPDLVIGTPLCEPIHGEFESGTLASADIDSETAKPLCRFPNARAIDRSRRAF